jgi:hypothetical protein
MIIVDKAGLVRWKHGGKDDYDRPDSVLILEQLRLLQERDPYKNATVNGMIYTRPLNEQMFFLITDVLASSRGASVATGTGHIKGQN